MASTKTMRAIDRLRKAANLEATRKEVTLSDGTVFEMWVTPLTLAEKERALKMAKGDDTNEFVGNIDQNKTSQRRDRTSLQIELVENIFYKYFQFSWRPICSG